MTNSGKGTLLMLFGLLTIAAALGTAVVLAFYGDSYFAGFLSATIIWKWHDWLYKPINRVLQQGQTRPGLRRLNNGIEH